MRLDAGYLLALTLTALAGWVDAVGVTQTGGTFLSFMSGNTTQMAAALAVQNWLHARLIAAIIGLFVAGVAVGELIARGAGRFGAPMVLTAEALSLMAGALPDFAGYAATVFAMGLQNAALKRAGGVSVGLTYVTGSLVQVGRRLADGAFGQAALYGLIWFCMASGAAAGAYALSLSTKTALEAPAVAAGALAFVTAATRIARPA